MQFNFAYIPFFDTKLQIYGGEIVIISQSGECRIFYNEN